MGRRVIIPVSEESLDAEVDQHFGRAPYYALVEVREGKAEVIKYIPNPRASGFRSAELIAGLGIDAVVVRSSGIGRRALEVLRKSGTDVLVTESSKLREVLKELIRGSLKPFKGSGCQGIGSRP